MNESILYTTALLIPKSTIADLCGVSLKTLRRELAPLIDAGHIKWHNKSRSEKLFPKGGGSSKLVHRNDAMKILRYFNDGEMPK